MNIFKIWIPQRKQIIFARDVTFNEDAKFNPGENHEQLDIRIVNTVGNDPLNQEVESTQLELPMDTYDVEILDRADTPEKEQLQIDPPSPSTEDFMTPETSMDPGIDDQDPSAMRGFYPMLTASQDINLRISKSNIISGRC